MTRRRLAERPHRGSVVTLTKVWPRRSGDLDSTDDQALTPRDDLVVEAAVDDDIGHVFQQRSGPFADYRRTVTFDADNVVERTTYRLALPWFGWLFALPVRRALGSRDRRLDGWPRAWWAPPDRLDARQVHVLGLLAAASMASAMINTLFTQTVNFAADDFGVGDTGVGIAASVVRAGIVLVLPFALLADRRGRRPIIVRLAFAAPIVTALGAVAPSFPLLVATQAVGRPLGIAVDFLIAVVAAEEVPRNSRAYALSVLALASGLGAGVAVLALPLADLSPSSWRLVYLVALVWLVVAVDVARRLPETGRFQRPHAVRPRLDRRRLGVLASVALLSNVFVAPASIFQNGYLRDERGYTATIIAVFTFVTATPAALGLVLGGRLADVRGRRRVIAIGPPLAAALVVVSFTIGGSGMWLAMIGGAIVGAVAFPAMAVYRAELFPTGNRGLASGLQMTAALFGGIGGLLIAGQLLDRDIGHGTVMAGLAISQVLAVIVALANFPETAHQELEDLNPIDGHETGGGEHPHHDSPGSPIAGANR